ncbi:hypothetical protein BU26DRAFT_525885 [Trematosphaeria pertusa]|uniref:AA1-like domain-containing protein n=1 Tax=Trematosphaeria pertusa TaxID=390896 RepID=A0A6A6HS76_9PLEO|nr:uncharacterized protein BU26DRAFT_525885 [Trematosphaeria pertusa]KAF2240662.1 hypothetical protein BU26DRAFT_525885 [Trematosphaeria pertusa]
MRPSPSLSLLLSLPLLTLASPALLPRQDTTPDYGYWDATVTTDAGRPGWQTRQVSATYYNPGLAQPLSSTCTWSFVPQGTNGPPVETSRCDREGFAYAWGAPWYTLNLTQTVVLDGGEEVTLYGGALLERRCGLGAGNACSAQGRIEAGVTPL